MQKNNKRILVVVFTIAIAFTVIAFILPTTKNAVFYLSYLFTMFAILAQIYVFNLSLNDKTIKSKFYGFPLIKIGILYAVIQIVLGIIFILTSSFIALWLAVVVYILLAGAFIVGMVGADTAKEIVASQDIKVSKNISKMSNLLSELEICLENINDENIKKQLNNLVEEFRYSDPVSSDETKEIEMELENNINTLKKTIEDSDFKTVLTLISKIFQDLKKRNNLCKRNKEY